jgi:SAM-dependent methyltransferase
VIERLELGPAERVLFVSAPEAAVVVELAGRLERGVLVGLGAPQRRATRHLVNVMFQPGAPEEIPWRDGFFSLVLDLRGLWSDPAAAAREVARVLAPGGRACLAGVEPAPLIEAGLVALAAEGDLLVFEKPPRAAPPAAL